MNTQSSNTNRWLAIPTLLFSGGIALLLLSLMLPAKALSRSSWTPAKAKQYQAASLKLHSLSHASLHPTPDSDPKSQQKALEQADTEYKSIRAELDAATNRPKNIAFAMRLIGISLCLVGGVSLYFQGKKGK